MSSQATARARTPWFERVLGLGMLVFVALLTAVVVGAAAESKVSPGETAAVVALMVGVNGAILAYGVRVLRSGVSVSPTAVTVVTATRTRRFEPAAVQGFVLDPDRRYCVVKLQSGEEVACTTLGYGPGAPRRVREHAANQVNRLNAALSDAS